jgi:murein DD-endopeptidase MepM/ murein hydrolase activator NlpD
MLTIPWRTGVNMREFAYYNTPIRPLPPAELQRAQLTKLRDMNVKLVRFYAAAADCTIAECVENVRKALDLLDEFGMQAIVCLDDALGSGFSVPGTGGMHTAGGHYDKSYYTNQVYEESYIPFVEALVGQLGNHRAVMIWEIGNEHALHPNNPLPSRDEIEAFFQFAKRASETIKRLSPRRLVSTGLLNSRQISYALPDGELKDFAKRLYGLPSIDVIGIHYYQQDDEKGHGQIDIDVATHEVMKPFYIGELGAPRTIDRPPYYQQEIAAWQDKAFCVLPWSFDIHTADCNIGDDKAMARQFQGNTNNDFDRLCEIVQSFGTDAEPFLPREGVGSGIGTRVMAEAAPQRIFKVTFPMGLNIRTEPTTTSAIIGGLRRGETIEVEPDSRRIDADNKYIWWHHTRGWVAEKSIDDTTVFMEETQPEPIRDVRIIAEAVEQKFFRVTFPMGLNIRAEPSTNAPIIGDLQQGELIRVEPDSRHIDADVEFIWWHHTRGWTAEKSVGGRTVLMEEIDLSAVEALMAGRTTEPGTSIPFVDGGRVTDRMIARFIVDADETVDVNTLPMRDRLFTRLPVDLESVTFIQPFGNTAFAFSLGTGSYNYSQGLHGGIDLGYRSTLDRRVVVRAGVRGKVAPPQIAYNPNRVRVNVEGGYQVIYGHLSKDALPVPLNVGDEVNEDTIVGTIAPTAELRADGIGFDPHLHLEVRSLRHSPALILNPLMFMPNVMRMACINRMHQGFQPWIKWQTNFDQPVIRLQGDPPHIIGPRTG